MTVLTNKSKTKESEKDLWRTQPRLLDNIERYMGEAIVFDACASPGANLRPGFFSPEQDALTQSWPDRGLIWCNPPFSRKAAFVEKAAHEARTRGSRTVFCLPTDLVQKYWGIVHAYSRLVLVPDKRINFIDGRGNVTKGVNFQTCFPVIGGLTPDTSTCMYRIVRELTEGLE